MKKLLLLLTFIGLLFNGCSETDVDKTPTFAFGKNLDLTPEINPKGESLTFDFVSQFDWQTTVSEDWISVEPESGTAQDKSATVTFQPNKTGEARTGTITITLSNEESFYISVSQESEDVVFVDADKPYQIGYEGGEITIAISTNAEYIVDIPEEAKEWLTLADTRTLRDETLTFTATKNEGKDVRSAVVKLLGTNNEPLQTFTIEQQCVDIFESKTETEYTVSSDGGVVEIEVATNIEYTVEIPEEAQVWLRLADTRAYREEKLSFVVLENEEYSPRSAVVRLWDAKGLPLNKFIIAQSAKTGNPNQIIYSSAGGVVAPTTAVGFGASIISNVYEKGVGIITFTGDINAIPDNAFKNCKMLTGITLPETVVTIGANAFYGCEALPIFTIPDSVTSIGYQAFYGCTSLTSVTIGNSVTSIGQYAFYNCTGELTVNCNIPSASSAFYGSKFTKVTIGNGVTSIGDLAFRNCSSLTNVTIGNSVTSIGGSAFYSCTSLTSVTIPGSVTSIGYEAFSGCTGELIINSKIVETNDTGVNYPANPNNGWLYNAKFTKVTIGNSVTSIGDFAFYSCKSLTSITIPDSVTSIGDFAFQGCSSLTSVTIPDSVTSIGYYAFKGCKSLTRVTIGNSVTAIGRNAFQNCTSLKTFYGKFATEDNRCLIVNGVLNSFVIGCGATEYTIPDSVTKIGYCAFYNCTSLTSVTIPDSVTSIGNEAFRGCTSLTSVTIPDSVTSIGDFAFTGCSLLTRVDISDLSAWCKISFESGDANPLCYGAKLYLNGGELTDITIPSDIAEIKAYAFYGCISLKSITIPDGVTSIGNFAFRDCSSLTSVTIPDSVTSIGRYAFCSCSSLTSVYCKPTTPPTGGSDMFYNNASGRKIYVPRNSVSAYMSAEYWSEYDDYIVGYDF